MFCLSPCGRPVSKVSPPLCLRSPLSPYILLSNWLLFISSGISDTLLYYPGISMSSPLSADWPLWPQEGFDGSCMIYCMTFIIYCVHVKTERGCKGLVGKTDSHKNRVSYHQYRVNHTLLILAEHCETNVKFTVNIVLRHTAANSVSDVSNSGEAAPLGFPLCSLTGRITQICLVSSCWIKLSCIILLGAVCLGRCEISNHTRAPASRPFTAAGVGPVRTGLVRMFVRIISRIGVSSCCHRTYFKFWDVSEKTTCRSS